MIKHAEDKNEKEIPDQQQALRMRRLGMAFVSYAATMVLVVLLFAMGMVPLNVVFYIGFLVILVNFGFYLLFKTNYNLKFREPSLTSPQVVLSVIWVLLVMYFIEDGQARAAFMLVIPISLLYGILALDIRQFVKTGMWLLFFYCILISALWVNKPQVLGGPVELIQAIAFVMVIVESSIIGGFIYGLRSKLHQRNSELKDAMVKIEELANLDSLTGVYNRRRLFEALSQEVSRHSRYGSAFSVCLMDIDHFKQVNDTYGHQAGDEVLRESATEVSRDLRSIDCFGRYGGEEFLMILPQTPLEGAVVKAEKVRQQVESLRFPSVAEDLRTTISVGVAGYRKDEDIDELLSRADKCLYAAKNSGRNRVVAETEPKA